MSAPDPPSDSPGASALASEVTRLLSLRGKDETSEELLGLVYDELRALAKRAMAREPSGHTLQPTALVHEAWLRLVNTEGQSFENRAHFFRTAARAMRRILIDRARRVAQPKHGGGRLRVSLADVISGESEGGLGGTREIDLVELNQALDGLEQLDARMAEIVSMRFFAGFSVEETGQALGVSERTVKREWSVAKAWLYDRLGTDT